MSGVSVRALHHPDLGYMFEKHQYARIRCAGETSEWVVLIHNIFQHDHRSQSALSDYLLATIYSPLSSTFLFGKSADGENELILHFGDFDKMRTSEDAE